ncbi:MAG TPA: hypothetical protein VIS03_00900, partial [Kiloniellaceae bacterium]
AGGARDEPARGPQRSDVFTDDDLGFHPQGLDRFARAVHLMDSFILHDKARREEALRAAQARGLDAEELRKAVTASVTQARVNRRRMNPDRHAAKLLRETSLSFDEIANITGLDIYSVVGLKLKLRAVG